MKSADVQKEFIGFCQTFGLKEFTELKQKISESLQSLQDRMRFYPSSPDERSLNGALKAFAEKSDNFLKTLPDSGKGFSP